MNRGINIREIESEGITQIREWEPGIYVVHTQKSVETLKEKVRNGEINQGTQAFIPEYIKELNELTKTEEGRKTILQRLYGEKWKEKEWNK